MQAHVEAFFDPATFTYSYVVSDPATQRCAIVDSVLDYDPAAGRTSHQNADRLSAALYLKRELGGQLAIGEQITVVQNTFGKLFNAGPEFATDGRQFDRLFADGERFQVGTIEARAIHTPGHTPACLTYVIGDAPFVGAPLFMPDYGPADHIGQTGR